MTTERQITFWQVLASTLGAAILLGLFVLAFGGCATTDKAMVATVTAGDRVMKVWAGYYVRAYRNPAVNQVDLAQQKATVQRAYSAYQSACNEYDLVRAAVKQGIPSPNGLTPEQASKNAAEMLTQLSALVTVVTGTSPTTK